MKIADDIKKHIAKGDTEKALELLVNFTRDNVPEKHDEAVLLSGQYRQWKREMTLGVQQSTSELRRIELGIMNVLQKDKPAVKATPATSRTRTAPAGNPPKKSGKTLLIVGAMGLLFLLAGYFMFQPDEHYHVDPPAEEMLGESIDQGINDVVEEVPVDPPPREEPEEVVAVTNTNSEPEELINDPTAPEEPLVNGLSVLQVSIGGDDGVVVGFFVNVEGKVWEEQDADFNTRFVFSETGRDEWSVYLFDESRNVNIQLDLYTKKVMYSESGGEPALIYFVLEADDAVG